ncbi:hypothetical protein ACL02S_22295 [Nocardia sp. 004]|uniref:hypothetical protein n=1 Tax=Nocardia sp. 004 TaxID=3385978 RepID=UPI0039A28096
MTTFAEGLDNVDTITSDSGGAEDAKPPQQPAPLSPGSITTHTSLRLPYPELADELDPSGKHRQKLGTLTTRAERVFYACTVLSADIPVEVLGKEKEGLTAKVVANWLIALTGNTGDKNTKVSGPMNNPWKKWAIAIRSGKGAPPEIKPYIVTLLEQMRTEHDGATPVRPEWLETFSLWSHAPQNTNSRNGSAALTRTEMPQLATPDPADNPDTEHENSAAGDTARPGQQDQSTNTTTGELRAPPRELVKRQSATTPATVSDITKRAEDLDELSDAEWAEERKLAEWARHQLREQRKKNIAADLEAEDRRRATEAKLAKADHRDRRDTRKALSALRRKASPGAPLAALHRLQVATNLGAAFAVFCGMAWSASNVQHNIAGAATPSDPLYWFSYLLEAMISIMLVLIMVGKPMLVEWDADPEHIVWAEIGLLLMTIGLNTYPYLKNWDATEAAVHSVAPVMVGIALAIHHKMSEGIGKAINRAAKELSADTNPSPGAEADSPTPSLPELRQT